MKLSDDRRAEMLHATRGAAVAYLEDMEHIRTVVKRQDFSRGEVRRLSGILRRLLVEGDISNIAAPRLGRIVIRAPNNNAIYKSRNLKHLILFVSGLAGPITTWDVNPKTSISIPTNFSGRIDLPLKNFLTQRVVCYRGQWASRKAVIKYAAQVASGVHSGAPETPDEILLAKVRSGNYVRRKEDGTFHIALFNHGLDVDKTDFVYTKDAIDLTLLELLATAGFLTESPDLQTLEKTIIEEIS